MTQRIAPIARHIIPLLLQPWIRNITGLEHLPKQGGLIIASNHSSYLEHFLITSIVVPYMNRKLYVLAKKEHHEARLERAWNRLLGRYGVQIPIDRSKGEEALKTAETYLKKGEILLIYPEGTRTLTGKIQRGKTGVARLAALARVPVVPLGIKGTFEIMPKGTHIPRLKKAELHFGRPLYFRQHYGNPFTNAMLREITDAIMREIARLAGQTYAY